MASHGGLLAGFREWLIVKLGCGNNLSWCALVLELTFPDAESPRQQLLHNGSQERAVRSLFELLEEFWQERETPDGLRRIYLAYQEWLQHQDWYGPSSPQWVPESSERVKRRTSRKLAKGK
jgi:hypothetical protein